MIFEDDAKEKEIDELTRQLPKLQLHDMAYATAYVRLQVLTPNIAAMLPKPAGGPPHNSAATYQATASAVPVPRPFSWPFACLFCNDQGHRIRDCPVLVNYESAGRVARDADRKIVFGGRGHERVPFNPNGLKVEIDKHYGSALDLSRNLGELRREPVVRDTVPHLVPRVSAAFVRAEGVSLALIEELEWGNDRQHVNDEWKRAASVEDLPDDGEWMGYEELVVGDALVTTRTGARTGKGEAGVGKDRADVIGTGEDRLGKDEKGTGRVVEERRERGEEKRVWKPEGGRQFKRDAERAYSYESRAADPEAPTKMYERLLKVEVPNVTVGDLAALSGELRKVLVKNLRTTRVPTTEAALLVTDLPQVNSLCVSDGVALDYCTPLRKIGVTLAGGVEEVGLLDEGSEIVVVRKDLWEKLGHKMNDEKRMLMQAANGSTQLMDGCAEFMEIEVARMKTWAHAYVVPTAPFKLLLGRPWQRSVLLQKTEYVNGKVEVTIHNPRDRREARVVETRERKWGGAAKSVMYKNMGDVARTWKEWREGGLTSQRMIDQEPFPTSLASFLMSSTFEPDTSGRMLLYKKVTNKVWPVASTMPDYAKVKRRFPEDPLLSLPGLSLQPKEFREGSRLT